MAARSTKLDKDENPVTSGLNYTNKKLAGFKDDMSPLVRDLTASPVDTLSAGISGTRIAKEVPLGAARDLVTSRLAGEVTLSESFIGGSLNVPYSKHIAGFLDSVEGSLTSLGTLLKTTRSLLDLLKKLSVSFDDVLYAIIKATLDSIMNLVGLLNPSLGAHLLVVPPSIPKVKIGTTSIDQYFEDKYAALSSSLREEVSSRVAGTSRAFALRDRDYSSKAFKSANSASDLESTIIASLEDKYDYYRPFYQEYGTGSLENLGHSTGIILTSGGTLGTVKKTYDKWVELFGPSSGKSTVNKRLPRASITEFKLQGLTTDSRYRTHLEFNLKGHSYNPFEATLYLPVSYKVVIFRIVEGTFNSTMTKSLVELAPYDGLDLDTPIGSTYSDFFTDSESPKGTALLQSTSSTCAVVYRSLEGKFSLPFTNGEPTDSSLYHSYISNLDQSVDLDLGNGFTAGDTVQAFVFIGSKYATLGDEVVYTNASRSLKLSLPNKSSKAAKNSSLPNWQGRTLSFGHFEFIGKKLTQLTVGIKSMLERNVSNPLDASLELLDSYIALIDELRIGIMEIVNLLEYLANFELSGYVSVFSADKGSRGIKEAVKSHFSQLKEDGVTWDNQSTAAMVLVGQSNVVELVSVLGNFINLVFQPAGEEAVLSPIGSTVDATIVAASSIPTAVIPATSAVPGTFNLALNPAPCAASPEDIL
jgi:hypothetical protein